jgi:hypothetical protein
LVFESTAYAVNTYVDIPSGHGYVYILIPTGFTQPVQFTESNVGCIGLNVPMNNIGTVIINDTNGYPITYYIYRSYYMITGQIDVWMCI